MLLALFGNVVALIVFLTDPAKLKPKRRYSSYRLIRGITIRWRSVEQSEVTPSPVNAEELIGKRSSEKQITSTNPSKPNTPTQLTSSRHVSKSFNYYLASLAVSDLLMALVCIPFTFTQTCLGYWPFPWVLCPMVVYAQLVMVTASSLTNTAVSLNRLVGIFGPFRSLGHHSSNSSWHTAAHLFCIWFIAVTGSSVQLFVTRVSENEYHVPLCSESWDNNLHNRSIYSVVLLFVIYLIPLSIQSVTYGCIAYRLWKRTTPGEQLRSAELSQLRERKRIVRILAIIVLKFGICWLPSHVFFMLMDFTTLGDHLKPDSIRVIYGTCHWIAMSNSFVNPIIYLAMSKSFKMGFSHLLQRICPFQLQADQSRPNGQNDRTLSRTRS